MTGTLASRRAVITGLGALNSAGGDVESVWKNVRAGKVCLSTITRFDTSRFPISVGGQIAENSATAAVPRRFAAKTDRFTHFAFTAVGEALTGANLDLDNVDRDRTSVWFGNNTGGWDLCERGFREYYRDGADVVNPWQATAWFLAAPQGFLTIRHGVRGISKSFSGDRVSGGVALYYGAQALVRGRTDIVLAGGCEAPLSELSLLCFHSNGEMSEASNPEDAYRPFDQHASGTILGEGASAVVLEDDGAATRRGATVHARLLGGAHGTAPADPVAGYAAVLQRALAQAECRPEDIDLVICDGAGQPDSDRIEAAAIAAAFSGRDTPIPVTAVKGAFGHLYGAGFTADVIVGCLAARDSVIPPTTGYRSGPLPDGIALVSTPTPARIRRFAVCARSRYGACLVMIFASPAA